MMRIPRAIAVAMVLFAAAPVLAQSPRQLTAEDYRQAEKFVGYNTTALVLNAGLDIAIAGRWFINGDVKYLPIETGIQGRSPLGPSADVRFEPVIASAGIRYRF